MMLSLLADWKTYLLIFLLTALMTSGAFNVYLENQNAKLTNSITECQGAQIGAKAVLLDDQREIDALQSRLREEQLKSTARGNSIMSQVVPEDCEQAKNWVVDEMIKFHWHNDIPLL